MNKTLKIFLISIGSVFLLFLMINLGFNLWLKKGLPSFIKNNTPYIITYKNLDVSVFSGDIAAEDISIKTKKSQDLSVAEINGFVKQIKVGRLSLIALVKNKSFQTNLLQLEHPNLTIKLPLDSDKKSAIKKNDIYFELLDITNGRIDILKNNNQSLFSSKDLNLHVQNLTFNQNSDNDLPFEFDDYSLAANNFFVSINNNYNISAKSVKTENAQMDVEALQITPIQDFDNWRINNPNAKNYLSATIPKLRLQDVKLSNDKLSIKLIDVTNPTISLRENRVQKSDINKNKKPLLFDIQSVLISKANFKSLTPSGILMNDIENLDLTIKDLQLNSSQPKDKALFSLSEFDIANANINTFVIPNKAQFSLHDLKANFKNLSFPKKGDKNLPFDFDDYQFSFNQFSVAINNNYKLQTASVSAKDKQLLVSGLRINPLYNFATWKRHNPFSKNAINAIIPNLSIKGIAYQNNKLTAKTIIVDNPNVELRSHTARKKIKKATDQKLTFDLQNVVVRNASLKSLTEGGQTKATMHNINANSKNINNSSSDNNYGLPFSLGNFTISGKNAFIDAGTFYTIKFSNFKLDSTSVDLSNFKFSPKVSRGQFIKKIKVQEDLYDVTANRIKIAGMNWKKENNKPNIRVKNVQASQVYANIFRSKIPPPNTKIKKMYSQTLRDIQFPLLVENLDLLSSKLVYEEDKPDSQSPGKLLFSNLNLNVKNINSNKVKGADTKVPITISCMFMDASPMKVNWSFNTADLADNFTIAGNLYNMPAESITPFIEPFLNITATGNISNLGFNFKGNNNGISGDFKMIRENLKVEVLRKNSKEKNKFLSGVANVFLRHNSGDNPRHVRIEAKRNKEKSFFNLFWLGIEDGLKKTLLIIKI